MVNEQVIEMARGVISLSYPAEEAELLAFAQLVWDAALEEAAETCKGLIADWDDEAEKAGMRYCVKEIQGLKS